MQYAKGTCLLKQEQRTRPMAQQMPGLDPENRYNTISHFLKVRCKYVCANFFPTVRTALLRPGGLEKRAVRASLKCGDQRGLQIGNLAS